jgi:hypothetical protein
MHLSKPTSFNGSTHCPLIMLLRQYNRSIYFRYLGVQLNTHDSLDDFRTVTLAGPWKRVAVSGKGMGTFKIIPS